MQYAIYTSDGLNEHHIGAGRDWSFAVKQFDKLDKANLKSAKIMMITETGNKLNTIVRWPKQTKAA